MRIAMVSQFSLPRFTLAVLIAAVCNAALCAQDAMQMQTQMVQQQAQMAQHRRKCNSRRNKPPCNSSRLCNRLTRTDVCLPQGYRSFRKARPIPGTGHHKDRSSLAQLGHLLHDRWMDPNASLQSLSRSDPNHADHDPAGHCRQPVLRPQRGEERRLYAARWIVGSPRA